MGIRKFSLTSIAVILSSACVVNDIQAASFSEAFQQGQSARLNHEYQQLLIEQKRLELEELKKRQQARFHPNTTNREELNDHLIQQQKILLMLQQTTQVINFILHDTDYKGMTIQQIANTDEFKHYVEQNYEARFKEQTNE